MVASVTRSRFLPRLTAVNSDPVRSPADPGWPVADRAGTVVPWRRPQSVEPDGAKPIPEVRGPAPCCG